MNYLERNIEDYIINDSKIVLECDEMDIYEFPNKQDVPAGRYISMIMGIRPYSDRYGKKYFDVCKKIFSEKAYHQWNSGVIDKITYSYIRQRYMLGSDDERRFRADLSKIRNSKVLSEDNLIGVIAVITIGYAQNGNNGNIEKRRSTTFDADWFVDDYSDEFKISTAN